MTDLEQSAAVSQEYVQKLESLQSLKQKSSQLHQVAGSLKDSLSKFNMEKDSIAEFQFEMEQLMEEKLKHVEILRQIHSDINMMESVLKQTQEEHRSTKTRLNSLYSQYRPLKLCVSNISQELQTTLDNPAVVAEIDEQSLLGVISSISHSSSSNKQTVIKSFQLDLDQTSNVTACNLTSGPAPKQSKSSSQSSVPPMKKCTTCHQHIHRNAPICPLCKAKLRSRNPKRPRK